MRPDPYISRRQAAMALGRLLLIGALPGAAASLTACSSKPQPQDFLGIPSDRGSFTTGPLHEPIRAEIFIDPNCGHCAQLWENAKPLVDRLRIRWSPISQTPEGRRVAAALVLSNNPGALLEEHHRHLASSLPTPAPLARETVGRHADTLGASLKLIEAQGERLIKTGIEGVPLTVRTQAAGMPLATTTGAVPTADLAAFLGVQSGAPISSSTEPDAAASSVQAASPASAR